MTQPAPQTPAAPAAAADPAKPGAAAAATPPANDQPAAAAGIQSAAAAAPVGSAYRPDGLPDHLFGKDDKDTIGKLHAAYTGARTELGKKGFKAPETVDGYQLTEPDDLKGKLLVLDKDGKDPVFEAMKPFFHKNGISPEAANELTIELYKQAAAKHATDQAAAANDPNAADMGFKQLGGPDKAKPLQDGATAWINGVASKLGLDAGDVQELKYLTMHSQGLKVLNKLRGLTSEKPIPADFNADQSKKVTQADVEAIMSSQDYLDGDEATVAKAREMIRQKQIQEGKIKG